jgi:hypothetical protein
VLSSKLCLLPASCWFLIWLTLQPEMEDTCPSGTSVDFQVTTWRYIPEDRTVHNHCCDNLNSYIIASLFQRFFFIILVEGGDK